MVNGNIATGMTLVLGGTGKTGGRAAERLQARGVPTRVASRAGDPPFDWDDQSTWDAVLDGVSAAYISYAPDLAIPGATDAIGAFVERAEEHGVRRLVLLSGRGEKEAQCAELLIQRPDVEWTVVRASWFAQNFSEGAFVEMVQAGEIALPAGDVGEPFVDANDIADAGKSQELIDDIGAEFLEGARGTAPSAGPDTDATEAWNVAYMAEFGELPTRSFVREAYDAVIAIALAAELAGSTDGTAIRDALPKVASPPA